MELNEIILFFMFSAVISSCASSKFVPFNDKTYVLICRNDDSKELHHVFNAKRTVFTPYGNDAFSFYDTVLDSRSILKSNCKRIPKIWMGFQKLYLDKFRKLFSITEELKGGKIAYSSSKARRKRSSICAFGKFCGFMDKMCRKPSVCGHLPGKFSADFDGSIKNITEELFK
ncbi:uncharacterized protein LOC118195674 [Stegodyphus dumicola]|uniref:uncharacterized protein LOC118195674 n=1 Tax=Stegodyphus dumicola TaxID=202533 RepID=UPI0015AC87FD|nr:uncharacterized protein LOC118195674 [Stegodyphus dumicola]